MTEEQVKITYSIPHQYIEIVRAREIGDQLEPRLDRGEAACARLEDHRAWEQPGARPPRS